jgi:hypothetical protein
MGSACHEEKRRRVGRLTISCRSPPFVVVTDRGVLIIVVYSCAFLCLIKAQVGRVLDISSDQRMGQLGHNICEVDQVVLQ